MDGPEEVAGSLVVASGNAAILLELVEELFNQMTCPVQVLVVFAQLPAAAPGRNHDAFTSILQGSDDPLLGIISFVSDDRGSRRAGQ